MESCLRFFILLFAFLSSSLSDSWGQDLKLNEVRTLKTNINPVSSLDWTNEDMFKSIGSIYSGFLVGDTSDRVWFFSEEGVWYFSLSKREWEYYGEIKGMTNKHFGEYQSGSDRFIFWELEGSAVSEWRPGDDTLRLISKETKRFKLLENHNGIVHHSTGDIYAFGGRGFGFNHSTMYRFNQAVTLWSIVPLKDNQSIPSPRNSAISAYLSSTAEIHIFGGVSYTDNRADLSNRQQFLYDYWIFDIKESKWMSRPIYNISDDINPEFMPGKLKNYFHHISVNAAIDSKNELIWYHFRKTRDPSNGLMVYDLKNSYGARFPDDLLKNISLPGLRYITIDDRTGELLVFWTPFTTPGNNSTIKVTVYELPDPESVRSFLAKSRVLAYLKAITSLKSLMWIGFIFGLSGVCYVLFKKHFIPRYNRSKQNLSHHYNDTIVLTLDFCEKPTIYMNDQLLNHEFSPNELHLLIWLLWKNYHGDSYQITDTIEELFFSDFPNLDYSRKHRNITIKRINEQLQRLFKNYLDRENWIVDRPVSDDKRKRQYGIDLDGINVSVRFSTDQNTSVLPGMSYLWVENIRRDLQS